MSAPDSPRRLILFTLLAALLAVVLAWVLYQVRDVLLLLYVSGIFAIGLSPVVRAIERQKLVPVGTRVPRWVAILLLYLVVLGVVVLIVALIIPPLVQQARDLAVAMPGIIDRASSFLLERGLLDHELTWRDIMPAAPEGATAVGRVLNAVWGFVGGVFGFVSILILTFYFLVEADSLFQWFLRCFPSGRRRYVATLSREITYKLSAWLMGQFLLGATIGATAAIGLWLLGVPYFYVLAFIAAVGELIPIVGPILSAIPAVLVALSVSPMLALFVAIFFILQQQFENHILVPRVMSKQVGMSAVMVIVSLMIGGALLGIVGAILAVPTAAIVQVLTQELTQQNDA